MASLLVIVSLPSPFVLPGAYPLSLVVWLVFCLYFRLVLSDVLSPLLFLPCVRYNRREGLDSVA